MSYVNQESTQHPNTTQNFNRMHANDYNRNILSWIENSNFERDQAIINYEQWKMQHETLKAAFKKQGVELQNEKNRKMFNTDLEQYTQKKLKENSIAMIELEKKYCSVCNKTDRLEHENNWLRNQLSHFKSMFDEMEQRKDSENKRWGKDLIDWKGKNDVLNRDNNSNIDKISAWNTLINQLNQEKSIVKIDNDRLKNTIETSEWTVKTAEEKSRTIDGITNSYKRQIEDLNLELEKYKLKINWQYEQINKWNDDYSKALLEKQEAYDRSIQELRDKYEGILNEKAEEANELKGEFVSMKIERDKYYTEYNILRNEVDKISSTFREENEKYWRRYQDSEATALRVQSHFQDKIRLIAEKNEKLEKENKEIKEKLSVYTEQLNKKEDLHNRFAKNEKQLTEEIIKIQARINEVEKENNWLVSHLAREELRYKEWEDSSYLKVNAMEATWKNEGSIKGIEERINWLLNEQDEITVKMKDEYWRQRGNGDW